MNVIVKRKGLEFHTASDGFSYGDFNKAGKLDLWRVAKHFESGRAIGINYGFTKALKLSATVGLFVRYQTIEMYPEFYFTANVSSPWQMKSHVAHVGRTSYWYKSETHCRRSGKLLAESLCQAVRVSRSTHRPIDLLADRFAKFKAAETMTAPPRTVFPSKAPDRKSTFVLTTKALPSDTDSNQHVNQSACFKYCLDCVSFAAMEGKVLLMFSRDVAYYNVKSFESEYIGEMMAGDEVEVQCWQDDIELCTLYFLLRVQAKVVCRCKGEWYADGKGQLIEYQRKVLHQAGL